MALLVGRHVNKIDRKGRVSVPKMFRDALSQQNDGLPSLYAYPLFKVPAIECCGEAVMGRISDSLDDLDMFSDDQDDLASVLLESAHPLPFDPEGRVVLPAELMEHADMQGEAFFVGRGARFQIWSPETYRAHRGQAFERARARGATLRLRRPEDES